MDEITPIIVEDICMEKIRRNAEKYPVDMSKGSAKKYDEFLQASTLSRVRVLYAVEASTLTRVMML